MRPVRVYRNEGGRYYVVEQKRIVGPMKEIVLADARFVGNCILGYLSCAQEVLNEGSKFLGKNETFEHTNVQYDENNEVFVDEFGVPIYRADYVDILDNNVIAIYMKAYKPI